MRIEQCVVFCFLFLKFKKIRFPFSLLILILLPFSTWFQLLFLLFFSSVNLEEKNIFFLFGSVGNQTEPPLLFSCSNPSDLCLSFFKQDLDFSLFVCFDFADGPLEMIH